MHVHAPQSLPEGGGTSDTYFVQIDDQTLKGCVVAAEMPIQTDIPNASDNEAMCHKTA